MVVDGTILSQIEGYDENRKEIYKLHSEGENYSLIQMKPAIIKDDNPDDSYTILDVIDVVEQDADFDDFEDLEYHVERIVEVYKEDTDDLISAFIVTPDHYAIYVWRNNEYFAGYCDKTAELLVGHKGEICIMPLTADGAL